MSGGPGPDSGFAPADVGFDPVEAGFPDGVGVAFGLVIDLLFDLAALVDFDELHDLLLLGLELTVDSTVWLGFYLGPAGTISLPWLAQFLQGTLPKFGRGPG